MVMGSEFRELCSSPDRQWNSASTSVPSISPEVQNLMKRKPQKCRVTDHLTPNVCRTVYIHVNAIKFYALLYIHCVIKCYYIYTV